MKNKKAIMGLAALLILLFHFYIPFGKSPLEAFFYKGAYIGVDLFFLVSGASLGRRRDMKVLSFYGNRLQSTYLPFAVLAVICALYKHWSAKRLLQVLTGAELFKRGGGAFLWFLFGILLFYLVLPLMSRLKVRLGLRAFPILLLIWAALVTALQYGAGYSTIFILLNRYPIFLIGFFYQEFKELFSRKIRGAGFSGKGYSGRLFPGVFWLLILLVGALIVYKTGISPKLNKPLADFYYVCAIPMVLGIAQCMELISWRLRVLEWIGGFTLELYGLQMIFGYDLENKFLKLTGMSLAAFILTMLSLILMAFVYGKARMGIRKLIKNVSEKRKEN